MADRKISELTALTTPATGDLIPIVDISEVAAADKNKSITVGELLRGAPDGTAAAPGFAFESDGGNGMFLGGTDILAFSTGGTQAVTIDASQRVGIGTSSPATKLNLVSGTFRIDDGTTALDSFVSSGEAYTGAVTNHKLNFVTNNTVRATLDTSGRLGIGTTSPQGIFDVQSSASINAYMTSTGGNTNLRLVAQDGGTSSLVFGDASDAFTGGIRFDHSDESLQLLGYNYAERLRIDSSGRLLVGTSSALTNIARYGSDTTPANQFRTNSTSNWDTGLSLINYSASGYAPTLTFGLSASNTAGTNTLVANGHRLGVITFNGNDATNFEEAVRIEAFVDGTPGANDMPGRLVFSTTADGASSPTERMRIQQNGNIAYYNLTSIVPASDNTVTLGASGYRWSAVWAANGTIQTSDERAKSDITTSALGSDFIKSLRPVSYKWVEGKKRDTGERDEDGNWIYESVPGERTHWGFIAQEVKQSVDAAGVDFGGWVLTDKDDPNSEQALRYDQFIAPLTKALQEAIAKIETLEAKVAALEAN